MRHIFEAVGGLVVEERLYLLRVRFGGVMLLVEDGGNGVVPLQLVEVGMGLDFESRETVGDSTSEFSDIFSYRAAVAEKGVGNGSEDVYRCLGGSGFLLWCHIGDVVDEQVGVHQQFFAGIGEGSQSACGLESKSHIDIRGIVLSSLLYQVGVEDGIFR